MLDKPQVRSEIINFFEKFCNNKLNKNVYNINFYKNRNSEHIFHYINEYFKNTVLEHASIAQKYYHIYWNHMDIPSTPFCNFQVGYRKGRRTFSSKNTKWIKNFLINFVPEKSTTEYVLQIAKAKLFKYLQTMSYKKLSEDTDLLNFIFEQQKHLIADNYAKVVLFLLDDSLCKCGAPKKINSSLQILRTCGSKECIKNIRSENGLNRDLSYLQTPEAKTKRVTSRSWYKHSEETKARIVETNKKTWTPEKKSLLVEKNKADGVYERSSQKMKQKILSGEFTPRTQNRLTHKRLHSEITGIKKYRSNWEVKYHEAYPHLLYEYLRIPYVFNNVQHIYIVDFWDPDKRTAIEIKPFSMAQSPRNIAKEDALREWCKTNNAFCMLVTEKEFSFV
jgi:hypothetical protein